jgi:ferredoxin
MAEFKVGAGKGVYKFAMAVSPLDCMGCAVCVGTCPAKALTMEPLESQKDQQPVFDYMVASVAEKKELQDNSVKGSQFKQPMLEFSGSCAGCAETSYARLVTQLFGDHMMISNATGCSSIWGGPAATSPYTVNKEGKGPAWANSLFEDNAEHGLGMYLGQKKIRDDLKAKVEAMMAAPSCCEELKAAGAKRALVLPVSGAFHSPLMQAAKDELAAAIEKTEFHTPCCPVYQNVDALPHTDPAEIKQNLMAQLTGSVRWTKSVQNMIADGATEFTECGPGKALQGMIAKIDRNVTVQGC